MKKNKIYVKTNEGDIYKITSNEDIFLKVSPYSVNEDRRKNRTELMCMINENKAYFINKNKALEEINTLWRKNKETWKYCGNIYKTKENESFSFGRAKKHNFYHTYTNVRGEIVTVPHTYYVCVFHGKLCWVEHSQYYPRFCVYKFVNIDTEPSYNDFLQWTHIKNLKNLYWLNYDNKWDYV